MYKVVIRSFEDNSIEKELKNIHSKRQAERIERGIEINLNNDKYYTMIEEDNSETTKTTFGNEG